MPKPTTSAFDLKESKLKGRWKSWEDLAIWLSNELDLAISARTGTAPEIEYCWAYYEQRRMRGDNAPWPDAADLPSPYAPEYTDAVHARLMQTIFVEPVWTVEGWGESARKAPFVEEFHQRAQEDERLQNFVDEWLLRGLVEGVGTLEVTEAFELRRERQRKRVALAIDPATGLPVMGDDAQPVLQRDETGAYVEPQDEQTPSAEVDVDVWNPVRLGPDYDVIPYLDFYVLPAHARNRKQVWGYAKRFYRRVPELQHAAERGIYGKQEVTDIGTEDERNYQQRDAPSTPTPVTQQGPTAQKELFECQLLLDLDGEGERWWRITIHKDKRILLRVKVDDRTTRYIRWMPFPKPGNMDRGYSLIGNKLITVIEEDTARRNMKADRMALVAGQPIKRRQGALWNPYEQPFGPRQVIDVMDMAEVEPMSGIPDVPASVMAWGSEIRGDADRLIGQNDTALGVDTQEARTLGEVQLRAGYAEVRINVIVKRMQEALEELGQARHTIWKRTLRSNPNLPPQRAMVIGREAQGIDVQGVVQGDSVNADLLEGVFWFKPRGSVETADLNRQRLDFNMAMQTLPALLQLNPAIAAIFQTMPAAKALVKTWLKVNRIPDEQSFIGSEAHGVFERMQMMQMMQEMQNDPRMQILMAMGGAPQAHLGPAPTDQGQPQGPEPAPTGPQGVGIQ